MDLLPGHPIKRFDPPSPITGEETMSAMLCCDDIAFAPSCGGASGQPRHENAFVTSTVGPVVKMRDVAGGDTIIAVLETIQRIVDLEPSNADTAGRTIA